MDRIEADLAAWWSAVRSWLLVRKVWLALCAGCFLLGVAVAL